MKHWEWCTAMGLHSNIPECCVIAWVSDLVAGIEKISLHRQKQVGESYKLYRGQYVPCLDCAEKGYSQKLHVCRPNNPECQPLIQEFEARTGHPFFSEKQLRYYASKEDCQSGNGSGC